MSGDGGGTRPHRVMSGGDRPDKRMNDDGSGGGAMA